MACIRIARALGNARVDGCPNLSDVWTWPGIHPFDLERGAFLEVLESRVGDPSGLETQLGQTRQARQVGQALIGDLRAGMY